MSLFSPRRYQMPYLPYARDSVPIRAFTAFERWAKSIGFSCRMCGNCILQETAFICPMTCPKGLRNGPCGGSENGHCEINAEVPCAWQLIYDRLSSMGKLDRLLEIQPPKNWRTSRDGGPRKIVRPDLRLASEEE